MPHSSEVYLQRLLQLLQSAAARKITATNIDSSSADDGQVLTADGAGGAVWEDAAGGGPLELIGTYLVGPDKTGDARGDYAIDIQTRRSDPSEVASGYGSIAIGSMAKAMANHCVSIGSQAYSKGSPGMYSLYGDSIAIGRLAYAGAENAVAIGQGAAARGQKSFAMGENSKAYQLKSFAMGPSAVAQGLSAIGMGAYVNAYGDSSLSVGSQSRSLGKMSVSIGDFAYADVDYAIAIGNRMVADGSPYIVKIGHKVYDPGTYSWVDGFDFGMTATGVFSMMDWKVRRNPVARAVAATHTLSIDLNGSIYHVLLTSVAP